MLCKGHGHGRAGASGKHVVSEELPFASRQPPGSLVVEQQTQPFLPVLVTSSRAATCCFNVPELPIDCCFASPSPSLLPFIFPHQAPVYYRHPFTALSSQRSLTPYVVLDIEPVRGAAQPGQQGGGYGQGHGQGQGGGGAGRYCLAEAQVARVSDFGRNDTTFYVRTHLGNILHPGKGVRGLRIQGLRPSVL